MIRSKRIINLDDETIQHILALREENVSLRKIGAAVALSHGSIIRILQWQSTGVRPKPSEPRIPARPRNGLGTLPDFAKVASFEAAGGTIKAAWRDYAQSDPSAYSYAHFSTLYNVWLEEQQSRSRASDEGGASIDGMSFAPAPDSADELMSGYSADEDHRAELYWRCKADPRSPIYVLCGHGCSLKVRNGELVGFDTGVERYFAKVIHGLRAVVLLGSSGHITVDAIAWCAAQGVGIYVLGWHGELVSVLSAALPPHNKIGESSTLALRRAQFGADPLMVAKAILLQKQCLGDPSNDRAHT